MKIYAAILGLLLPIIIIASLNWIVDPNCIFHCHDQQKRTSATYSHDRVALAVAVRNIKPDNIFLGTSRTRMGININHIKWLSGSILNMGIDAGQISELRRYFEHAQAIHPLRRVILELDSDNYNAMVRADFIQDRLLTTSTNDYSDYYLQLLQDYYTESTSLTTTMNSIIKILHLRYYQEVLPFRQRLKHIVLREDPINPSLVPVNGTAEYELRQILTAAKDNKILVTVYIPPFPADHYLKRNWLEFEQWKKNLMQTIDEVYGHPIQSVSIWDFSGFNTITTERISQASTNEWFFNDTHFTQKTGDMILERIFQRCERKCVAPSDFGVQLTKSSSEKFFKTQRTKYNEYRTKRGIK